MADEMPAEWTPAPRERQYFRHVESGELGYLVRRQGQQKVKLHNEGQESLRAWVPGNWTAEVVRRELSKFAIARVAFEADKVLCRELGLHGIARRIWDKLTDAQRQAFAKDGPTGPQASRRRLVYLAIVMGIEKGNEL